MKNIPLPPSPHQPKKYTGPSAAEILALRKQFMNPGIFLYYKNPIMLVEGAMQYVWDETGKRYLDGLGGIGVAKVIEHHRAGPYLRNGVCDALACDIRGGAMHRLEHGRELAFGVQVR